MEQGIMQFFQMIPTEFYIIVGVLYVIGYVLRSTEVIPNKYILFILLILGIVFAVFKGGFNIDSVMYGIILSMAPVYINQFYKQGKKVILDPKEEK